MPNPYRTEDSRQFLTQFSIWLIPRTRFDDLKFRSPAKNGGGLSLVIVSRGV